jgi:hypothetical protein
MLPPLGKEILPPQNNLVALRRYQQMPRRNLNKNHIYFTVSGKLKMKATKPGSILPSFSRRVLHIFRLSHLILLYHMLYGLVFGQLAIGNPVHIKGGRNHRDKSVRETI